MSEATPAVNLPPEWTHPIVADTITGETLKLSITPDDDAIKNLLRRLNLIGIEKLRADLKIKRDQGGMVVYIKGKIKAKIIQKCVVTLDPIADDINEGFEAWFADPDQAVALSKVKQEKQIKTSGETPILEEHEDPEAIINGQIDLGELVTQHLSLMINPYPHAQDVHYEYGDDEPQKVPDAFKSNPFAALKDWKSKLEEE